MESNRKPIIYMYYNNIYNIGTRWAKDLKKELINYNKNTIAIQFGLQLTGSLVSIADGSLDNDIANFLDGCEELGLPIYLRIGYEFNGYAWNGYDSEQYKAAFIYLTEKIRIKDLEIATVWNYAPDGLANFMDFYPGDEFVDWWAINIFEANQTSHTTSKAFIDSSESHGRPLIIGESTPRYIGVLDGEQDWNSWFVPFFDFIKSTPAIKMTGYINWDWSQWSEWSNWGDARLESNEFVRNNFKIELDDTVYFHAGAEKEFRTQLGYTENESPSAVQNIIVKDEEYPATISWDPVNDESNIARYLIFDNDSLIDYTAKTELKFINYDSYQSLNISIVALDRAGNVSFASEPVSLVIPPLPGDPNNVIINGDFEFGTEPWEFEMFDSGAQASFSIDTTYQLNSRNSAKISIAQSTNTNFHIQLRQAFKVKEGKDYIIQYEARASNNTNIETWIQQNSSPYNDYAFKTVSLTTESKTFIDTGFVSIDDDVFLVFMIGNSGNTNIWIDNVTIVETVLPKGSETLINGNFKNGTEGWIFNKYVPDVDGIFDIDTTGILDGVNSAHILINKNTGINWNLQLQQPIIVKKDKKYAISYKAKSATPTIIETWVQQDHSPYFGYANKVINLTTESQTFTDITSVVPEDDNVYMTFMLGTSGLTEIWIGAISVVEIDALVGIDDKNLSDSPEIFELYNAYPNPFNNSTIISYSIPHDGLVKLTVYSVLGELVENLVNREMVKGSYSFNFRSNKLSSGIYYYRIEYDSRNYINKLILLK